jgi:uncharacterized protein YhbP (UPF0306 family)
MDSYLEKIEEFISKHHVMSLATSSENELSVCSLFYAYDFSSQSFIVASSDETTHIQHINHNPQIAGNILLETKKVGEIKGLQFRGKFSELEDTKSKLLYFKSFPYSLALNPKLWQIKVEYFKMTDNSFGFGKKLIWTESSVQT